jgi:hypothetical protein
MAKKMPARDQVVKLIVGAGQASPSPPVGPALGSKGVKSIDFCKVGRHSNYGEDSIGSRLRRSSTPELLISLLAFPSQLELQSAPTAHSLSI